MEHLPIHVADEVLLGGPVHYRWMYPFERFIFRLKKLARNKSKPEASIVKAYMMQETTFLGSDYLGPEFRTNASIAKRNEILSGASEDASVSIYNHLGKGGAVVHKRYLTEQEHTHATYYIFSNTPEMDDYMRTFESMLSSQRANMNPSRVLQLTIQQFPRWLQDQVMAGYGVQSIAPWLMDVVMGFQARVSCYSTYKINNYKFATEAHCEHRPTTNCHVHVKAGGDTGFYGVIEEIIEIHTKRNRELSVVLFKCRWFDPRHTNVYPANGIIEVNMQKLYKSYDPFILAQQAEQVYYTYFPGLPKKSEKGIWAVCKMKPTNTIDMDLGDLPYQDDPDSGDALPTVGVVETREPLAVENSINEYDPTEDLNLVESENEDEEEMSSTEELLNDSD